MKEYANFFSQLLDLCKIRPETWINKDSQYCKYHAFKGALWVRVNSQESRVMVCISMCAIHQSKQNHYKWKTKMFTQAVPAGVIQWVWLLQPPQGKIPPSRKQLHRPQQTGGMQHTAFLHQPPFLWSSSMSIFEVCSMININESIKRNTKSAGTGQCLINKIFKHPYQQVSVWNPRPLEKRSVKC